MSDKFISVTLAATYVVQQAHEYVKRGQSQSLSDSASLAEGEAAFKGTEQPPHYGCIQHAGKGYVEE